MPNRLMTLIILTTLSACSGNDNTYTVELDSGTTETISTGANASTGGTSNASSTGGNTSTGGSSGYTTSRPDTIIVNGITVHSDMSGYTYSCFSQSQQIISCMPTLSGVTPGQYKYCSTMLSRECLDGNKIASIPAIYECWTC